MEEQAFNQDRYALRQNIVTELTENLNCKQWQEYQDLDQTFCDLDNFWNELYLRKANDIYP